MLFWKEPALLDRDQDLAEISFGNAELHIMMLPCIFRWIIRPFGQHCPGRLVFLAITLSSVTIPLHCYFISPRPIYTKATLFHNYYYLQTNKVSKRFLINWFDCFPVAQLQHHLLSGHLCHTVDCDVLHLLQNVACTEIASDRWGMLKLTNGGHPHQTQSRRHAARLNSCVCKWETRSFER